MNSRVLAVALALLCSGGACAQDNLDVWQPGVYFKLDFGGSDNKAQPHFGARMGLTENTVQELSGGSLHLRVMEAVFGETGLAGKRPANMSFNYTPGVALSTQLMGGELLRYSYDSGFNDEPLFDLTIAPISPALPAKETYSDSFFADLSRVIGFTAQRLAEPAMFVPNYLAQRREAALAAEAPAGLVAAPMLPAPAKN